MRENKDSEKETDLRHIRNERKEPRPNKGFLVKGGNISRMERNYDYEAFGRREGESQSIAIKLGFRNAITMKLKVFHRKSRPLLPVPVEIRWWITAFQ